MIYTIKSIKRCMATSNQAMRQYGQSQTDLNLSYKFGVIDEYL